MWTLLFIIKHSKTHSDYLPSDDNIKGFIVKQWGHEWVTKGLVHPTPLFACGASKLARDCFPLPGHHLIARHRIQKSWTRWMAIILDKSYCYKIRCICGFSFFFFQKLLQKQLAVLSSTMVEENLAKFISQGRRKPSDWHKAASIAVH